MKSGPGKRSAFSKAIRSLVDGIHGQSGLFPTWIPRPRTGKDKLVILGYGVDGRPDASNAAKRLRWSRLPSDYIQILLPETSELPNRARLGHLLSSASGRSLGIRAWSLPFGLQVTKPDSDARWQRTFLVLVHDSGLNDISMQMERENFLGPMGNQNSKKLVQAESELGGLMLTNGRGAAMPAFRETSVVGEHEIVVVGFELVDLGIESGAERIRASDPFKSLVVKRNGGRIVAILDASVASGAERVAIKLHGDNVHVATEQRTRSGKLEFHFDSIPSGLMGQRVKCDVMLFSQNRHELLGTTEYAVVYSDTIRLPGTDVQTVAVALLWVAASMPLLLCLWLWHRFTALMRGHPYAVVADGVPIIRLPRPTETNATIHIESFGPRLALLMPPRWERRLFLRYGTLTIPIGVTAYDERSRALLGPEIRTSNVRGTAIQVNFDDRFEMELEPGATVAEATWKLKVSRIA